MTAKVVALFNHKGGVSKTTTTFNLGWQMARIGKRVLMVDADPQCNLTGLTLGIDDYNTLFSFYEKRKNSNMYDSLKDCFELGTKITGGITTTNTKNENLNVLAGHVKFASFDIQLASAITGSQRLPILRSYLGSINDLIRKSAATGNFDIVLIDMSPSISSTNMCLLMSADYFIIPTSPDFFCYQAIDSLSNVFPDWVETLKDFKNDIDLPRANPKLLGIISQNYRIYGTEENSSSNPEDMTKTYKEWSDKIKKITNDLLVPKLKEYNMIIEKEVFEKAVSYDIPYNLANIQNFNTLIPTSQKLSKPIFELEQQDNHNWQAGIWERKQGDKMVGVKYNIEKAKEVYKKFADSVIKMVC